MATKKEFTTVADRMRHLEKLLAGIDKKLLAKKKITTGQAGEPKTDVEMLLTASFGQGDPWAQLLAALAAACFAPPPKAETTKAAVLRLARGEMIKTLILETVWKALGKRDGQLLRDLGNAVDAQRRDPLGYDPLSAALLARKIQRRRPPPIREIVSALESAGVSVPSDTHLKRIQKALGVQPQGGKPGHPEKRKPEAPPPSISDLHQVFKAAGLLVPELRKPRFTK